MRIIEPSFTILDELDQQSLPVRIEFCGRICYKSENRIDSDSAIPFVRKMAENGHNSVLEMGVLTLVVTCATARSDSQRSSSLPTQILADRPPGRQSVADHRLHPDLSRDAAFFTPKILSPVPSPSTLKEQHPYFFDTLPINDTTGKDCVGVTIAKMALKDVEQLAAPLHAKHRYLAVKFIVNRAVTHELVRHRPCTFLQESQRYCRYSADKFGNEVTFIKPVFFEEHSEEFTVWKQSMEAMEAQYFRLLQTSSPQAARTVLPNSCKTEIIVYANLLEWQHILSLRTSPAAEPSMREVMIPLAQQLAEPLSCPLSLTP